MNIASRQAALQAAILRVHGERVLVYPADGSPEFSATAVWTDRPRSMSMLDGPDVSAREITATFGAADARRIATDAILVRDQFRYRVCEPPEPDDSGLTVCRLHVEGPT